MLLEEKNKLQTLQIEMMICLQDVATGTIVKANGVVSHFFFVGFKIHMSWNSYLIFLMKSRTWGKIDHRIQGNNHDYYSA